MLIRMKRWSLEDAKRILCITLYSILYLQCARICMFFVMNGIGWFKCFFCVSIPFSVHLFAKAIWFIYYVRFFWRFIFAIYHCYCSTSIFISYAPKFFEMKTKTHLLHCLPFFGDILLFIFSVQKKQQIDNFNLHHEIKRLLPFCFTKFKRKGLTTTTMTVVAATATTAAMTTMTTHRFGVPFF